ncbi:glycosyltransferase family 2 protein [Chlorobium phaeovibrioides]|uniref:Glycosyltransferase n=1 Tax=Chlorobium phaeovibrioides TaxID=1094 RepID=A0ABW9USX8_CHLPH|nr:glycosyltransferase family 2 protein [Chlorobium phaeovibrioides]MWV55176.1 glycosyltransferase [Chlorobium phaeovibrioides]
MKNPQVTILMPVHNGERYLTEAIDSILKQSFTDFEFLIIDDGSTDGSTTIVKSYEDPRIRLIANPENHGTVHVLNQGISEAKGTYIARMDADDISLPTRLEKQVHFMDNHPEIGISGTAMRLIKNGKLKNTRTLPETDEELKIQLLFSTCFFHPTVIMRSDLAKAHPYPENLIYTQDYNYWTSLADKTAFANIPETLLYFREHAGQLSSRKADLQVTNARRIREGYLRRLTEDISLEELEIHHRIAENQKDIDLRKAEKWLKRLVEINLVTGIFGSGTFQKEMARKWWLTCRKSTPSGRTVLEQYRSSSLRPYYQPEMIKYLKFMLRSIMAGTHHIPTGHSTKQE